MTTSTSPDRQERAYLTGLRRILTIHTEIGRGGFPRVTDLARKLDVSTRTIKRDLDVMRNLMNAPVVYDRQRKGFRYSSPGWSFPPSRLTEGELLTFFVAESALKKMGQTPEARLLRQALAKLAVMLPEHVVVNLEQLGEHVSFQTSPAVTIDSTIVALIAQSAIDRVPIEFDYYSPHRNELTSRVAEVHLVHNFLGDWYAVSFDRLRQGFRDFHIGRMKNIRRRENECFDMQPGWNAEDYLNRGFSMMRGGRLVGTSILFDSYQARWMRERDSIHPGAVYEDLPDGSLRIRFKVGEAGLEAVARFCLQYAGNCVAEKPKKLREIIRQKLERATLQYGST